MTDVPELRRDRADAKLAGVCAALARSWNVDVTWVRFGLILLTLVSNGLMAFAYFALALLIPERGSDRAPIRDLLPVTRSWSREQLGVAVGGTAMVFGLATPGAGPGAVLLPQVVRAIIRWGARRPGTPPPPPPAPAPRTEFERLAQAWQHRMADVASGRPATWGSMSDADPYGLFSDAPAPVPSPPTSPSRRGRTLRTWSGVAVWMGLAWGGLAIAREEGVWVPPTAWPSVTLAVLALALVAVSRPARAQHGRPRGLRGVGVLAGVATALTLVGGPTVVTTGELPRPSHLITYTTESLPEAASFEAGARTLDLSQVAVDEDRTLSLAVDLGALRVILPAEGNVVLHYTVDLGSARMADGTQDTGADLSSTWSRVSDPSQPTLYLDVSVDLGSLEVVGS